MTMQALLLEAVEQRLLRHLDVQFAMMVAGEEPAVMLAAAILSKDAGEGHVCLPLSRLAVDEKMPPALLPRILAGPGSSSPPASMTGLALTLPRRRGQSSLRSSAAAWSAWGPRWSICSIVFSSAPKFCF